VCFAPQEASLTQAINVTVRLSAEAASGASRAAAISGANLIAITSSLIEA
jgi:hypothetical protein